MDVHEAIVKRRSVRAYSDRPIEPAVLEKLKAALRLAPSACNFQPWHFVFVSDAELRRELARACHGQLWMAQAPLTVAACGLPQLAYKHMGGSGNSVDIDVTIALDHLTLAAVAEGLGTCWIGAFDEQAVKRLLAVPPQAKVVALTPVGYPASDDLIHPVDPAARKHAREIFSRDRYGQPL